MGLVNDMPRVKAGLPSAGHSSVDSEIARLRDLDIEALRNRWRTTFRREAPHHLGRHLLFAMIAYRIQAEVIGDLDAETLRLLKQIDLAPSKQTAVPLTQAFDQRKRELSSGAVLTREWNGHHHRVMVVDGGFAWEGRTYNSLSIIAKAITGTKWNGPRFFGLRDSRQAGAPL
jgi:hypothetical protein